MNWARLTLCSLLLAAFLVPSLTEARPRYVKRTSFKATMVKRNYNRQPAGLHSHSGKLKAKRQIKAGNVSAACKTFKLMNSRPNRKGFKGVMDKYRKWSVGRAIKKEVHRQKVEAWLNKKHEPIPLELLPYWTKL